MNRTNKYARAYEAALEAALDHCCFCGVRDKFLHVDKYHRLTPLCGDCYHDPKIAKATASDPDDPSSWWNRKEVA
jgi:hypothetical protein